MVETPAARASRGVSISGRWRSFWFVHSSRAPPTPRQFSPTRALCGEDIANNTAVCDECVFQLGRRFEEGEADSVGGRVLGTVLEECVGSKDKGRKV